MTKTEWLEARKKGVGGSEVADVMNLEPYGCAARLWDEKRGIEPDYPMVETPAMIRGQEMEEFIAQKYSRESGFIVTKVAMKTSKEYEYILGNPDRLIIRAETDPAWGCLECKCPGRNTFKTIQREGLPYSWILQMQHYLYVCDLQWGAYAIQCCDPWEFDSFVVQRDNELIELSLEACHNFWRMVENGPRPDRLGQEDRRCKACNRTKKCYGLEEVPEPEAITDYEDGRSDINLKTAFLKYIEAGEIEKEAAEYKSECKNNLVDAMGERGKVITDVGKVIYSRANRSKFNANRFKATVSDEEYQKFVENYQVNSIRVYPI